MKGEFTASSFLSKQLAFEADEKQGRVTYADFYNDDVLKFTNNVQTVCTEVFAAGSEGTARHRRKVRIILVTPILQVRVKFNKDFKMSLSFIYYFLFNFQDARLL